MKYAFSTHTLPFLYYTSDLLSYYGFRHVFATRQGGVSVGDFASLNVSTARTDREGLFDHPERVEENYRIALDLLSVIPEKTSAAHQVHANTVLTVTADDGGKGVLAKAPLMPNGDGLVLDATAGGVECVAVKTADCVPILLANIKTGAVAAVHAGWRGTVSNIVGNAVSTLAKGDPSAVIAAIGPHIGKCCYEVGRNIYDSTKALFAPLGMEDSALLLCFSEKNDKDHVDMSLAEVNRLLLEHSGVPHDAISVCPLCTCCTKDNNGEAVFFSHRGMNGYSGTFVSAIRKKCVS